MRIKEMVELAHQNARDKGFHSVPSSFGDRIALVHSELSEALEAYRSGDDGYTKGPFDPIYSDPDGRPTRNPGHYSFTGDEAEMEFMPYKPEGVWSELADVVIRVADMCGLYGIDLEDAIKKKMSYNRTRPKLHGKKF